MIINERNIRIDSALRAAVKIGALSSSEYDEACRLITATEQAALPSDTAQAPEPVAYCRRDTVLDWKGQLVNAAMMFPSPAGLKDPIALYAGPVASASVTPIVKAVQLLAFLCRTETKRLDDETLKALGEVEDQLVALGFSVCNDDGELSTTDSAFGEARATAPQAATAVIKSDQQGSEAMSEEQKKIIERMWAADGICLLGQWQAPPPARTPIYQIGAPGIAGHHVVWWDVPQEEYERQKAAGYMKTGIVYREA